MAMKQNDELAQKFHQVLDSKGNEIYTLELRGWEVDILHSLLALAMDHPGMQKMSQPTHQAVRRYRGWCKEVWVKMGLSEEDATLVDRLREELTNYP